LVFYVYLCGFFKTPNMQKPFCAFHYHTFSKLTIFIYYINPYWYAVVHLWIEDSPSFHVQSFFCKKKIIITNNLQYFHKMFTPHFILTFFFFILH
jgi:hypothetical protein